MGSMQSSRNRKELASMSSSASACAVHTVPGSVSGPELMKTSTMTVNLIDGVAVVSLDVPDNKVQKIVMMI